MPTLRSHASSGVDSSSPKVLAISSPAIDPVTPAIERETPAANGTSGGSSRVRKCKKLEYAEQGVCRRSERLTRGEPKVSIADADVTEMGTNKAVVEKGKRKIEEVVPDSEGSASSSDSENETATEREVSSRIPRNSSGDGEVGMSGRSWGARGRARQARRSNARANAMPVQFAELHANAPGVGSSRAGPANGNSVPESTRQRFLDIARRRAAHFAHFPGEVEQPAEPAGEADVDVDEQRARAAQLLADVTAAVPRLATDDQEDWPGPFSTARRLVEDRAAATAARLDSLRAPADQPKPSVNWTPSRQATFRRARIPSSLHNLCVEVLCSNVEHVESLVGVPDATKNAISSRLCSRRGMTSAALRLYFGAAPAEIFVSDCSLATEEDLTEAFALCAIDRLEVLELGMCGRCLSDQLCATVLTPAANALPVLNTLALKGAYRLTDKGFTSFVLAAPSVTTLDLKQCNMVSEAGIQILANSLGPRLTALSLESCNQLIALKILPSLLQMTSLEKLNLSGISGMSDAIVSELAVVLGPNLHEFSIAECRALTDAAVEAVSLCCKNLRLLDLSHNPMLTDLAMQSIANGCRSLRTLRLNRGKFRDTAIAALVTASGQCLFELSLGGVGQAGDHTLVALSKHSKDTLNQLDVSWCRAMSDQALGLLADSCHMLRELRVFGCTQVTNLFLEGHSNVDLNVRGLSLRPEETSMHGTVKPVQNRSGCPRDDTVV